MSNSKDQVGGVNEMTVDEKFASFGLRNRPQLTDSEIEKLLIEFINHTQKFGESDSRILHNKDIIAQEFIGAFKQALSYKGYADKSKCQHFNRTNRVCDRCGVII